WQFAAPAGWGDAAAAGDASAATPGAAAITGVRQLVSALTGLQAGSAADFITDVKDLKEYGLNPDNPDLLRVELKGKDGPPEVAYVGKPPAPPPPAAGAPPVPPSNTVYVRVEGTPGVIRVTPGPAFDGVAAVVNDPTPLRDRDLLKDDLKTRTDAVDITVGKDTVKLRKVGGEWKLYGGPNDPQAASQKAVADLLALLGQPRLVKDFPARTDARFAPDQVKAEVKLWADAVEPSADPKADPKAEPKLRAGANPTTLVFGARDKEGTFVRRTLPGGAQADFVLPDRVKVGADPAEQDVVAAAGRRRLDLLDPTLKRFPEFLADRLTITQDKTVTLEVSREKAAGSALPENKWVYVKPDDRKGRPADAAAVGDLLRLLADTSVGRFVAEQPTPQQLAGYGLAPENPRLKAEVGLDPGPAPLGGTPPAADKERVYFFGNETEDKQSVYARVGGREPVFTVPKATFDKLAGADVRDRTVAAFDPAKVKGVTVRGWKEATGAVVELAFERKPGGWAVGKSSLPGFDVAPAKVDEFVRAVRELRVKGDLPPGRLPKYRFPPEEGGFEITLDRDGEPPVVLDLGAPVESGDRAAVLGKPGAEALFTLPADALKAYREGTKAFAR
ncbi:MAG: DUF4340 domain-containing protein, partial [Gemmataceae bacterium]|nr:DUF4340 domain-containing protein [Gemmataceae bacterium]